MVVVNNNIILELLLKVDRTISLIELVQRAKWWIFIHSPSAVWAIYAPVSLPLFFSSLSLPADLTMSFTHPHTHIHTHTVTREYSLYMAGSIRCISWWWKVVLMWCLQSSTGEMDIWSSIWPNLTPGLLPDLISLLLGAEVGVFKQFFFFLLHSFGQHLVKWLLPGCFRAQKIAKCVISGNRIQCWNSTLSFSCRIPRCLVLFIACCWSDHKGQSIKYKVILHSLTVAAAVFFLFSNWRNISAGTHTQGHTQIQCTRSSFRGCAGFMWPQSPLIYQ